MDTHIAEHGPHEGHTLELQTDGRVHCANCHVNLTWEQAEQAWPTGESWPAESSAAAKA